MAELFQDGQIYKNQTKLRIRCECGDILGAASALVGFKDPDGLFGSWTGVIEDMTPTGHVYKDITATGQLNVSGEWRFWPIVTFSDGGVAPGKAIRLRIYDQGE
jgi:hypothetical protein